MGVMSPPGVATATLTSTVGFSFRVPVAASKDAFISGTSRSARPAHRMIKSLTETWASNQRRVGSLCCKIEMYQGNCNFQHVKRERTKVNLLQYL